MARQKSLATEKKTASGVRLGFRQKLWLAVGELHSKLGADIVVIERENYTRPSLDKQRLSELIDLVSTIGLGCAYIRADYILANPQFNDSDRFSKDDNVRWQFGVPPKGNANFSWVQVPNVASVTASNRPSLLTPATPAHSSVLAWESPSPI